MDAKLAGLGDVDAFRELLPASRALLARGLRYLQVPKRAPVLGKGQKVSGAFVVMSGALRVYTLSPSGSEATLYVIRPGETCVLALNCIFNDLLYPAWVDASEASRIAVIPGPVYRELFEREPSIRNSTVQAFSTIVFRLMSELEGLHAHRLEQRLANFLLLHAASDGTVRMTLQEVASHLVTTREGVARALRQLASKKRVRTRRNAIVITEPAKLAAGS